MYALTLVMPKQTAHSRAQADRHYHYCRTIFEEGAIDNPNPFTVAAMYLISMYSLNVTFSYNNVVVTLGIAVRLAQQLNFETARQIQWELPDGEILGTDEGTGKHFRGMIWLCLNESDLIVSFLRNIPFMFSINAQFPISEMESTTGKIYNPFAASGMYGHFLALFQHARKIVGFMRKDIDFNNSDWKSEQSRLYTEITKWHDDLPKWMTELPEDYGFDELSKSPPSWRVAYMLCFYHMFVIILYKSSLLIIIEHFQEPQTHEIFTRCLESSFMIAKIFEKFLKTNAEFYGCNTIICYIPFVAGAIFCIDTIVLGKSPKLIEKIDSCIDVMDAMAVRFPALSVRTELLRQWKADPEVALNTFGTKRRNAGMPCECSANKKLQKESQSEKDDSSEHSSDGQEFTYKSFPVIELGGGRTCDWVEAFFEHVHPSMPFISKQWFLDNLKTQPLSLLHAMYANTVAKLTGSNLGDGHIAHCLSMDPDFYDDSTPLDVIIKLLVANYSLQFQNTRSQGDLRMVGAIRSFQNLMGGYSAADFNCFEDVLSLDVPSREVCQMIYYVLYEYDFLTTMKTRMPSLFADSKMIDLTLYSESYDKYYNSDIWIHHIKLMQIAKKVDIYSRALEITEGERDCLLEELERWYQEISESADIQSTNLQIAYYGLQILLYRPFYIKEYNSQNNIVEKTLESATKIKTLKVQQENELTSYFIFISAVVEYISNNTNPQINLKRWFSNKEEAIEGFKDNLYQIYTRYIK
ncbi:hypothetical protein HK103_005628 [Boothiomyces macroporosus]|uniref:Transcription factor domain-containing protein n=1 Tax=Boothiomyces macroporosus TaxID=261099 RepID=A0AAD5UEZ1_9FUNG|nr:hypothetical protein HK103_005628 [Boothiomyces macroporosus]